MKLSLTLQVSVEREAFNQAPNDATKQNGSKGRNAMSENQTSQEQPETNILGSASDGIQQGVADANAAASESASSISQSLGKVVYNTFYYASYYVTFAALTAAKLLPLDNAVGRGLHDGAAAAQQALHTAEKQAAAAATAEPVVMSSPGLAPA